MTWRTTWAGSLARGGNVNNDFFDPLSRRLRRIIGFYRRLGGDATLTTEAAVRGERWVYRIIDYELLPFERLKPFFRASHVDDAIKMGIALGLRELPGVRIYQDQESQDD